MNEIQIFNSSELGLASKEVVEKFTQMGITGKTHSSTVTLDQIKRLKDFIANGGVKKTTKPKAFVVKKAKAPEPVVEEKKETKPAEKKPLIEKVPRIEKVERPKVEVVKPVSRLEIVRRAQNRGGSRERGLCKHGREPGYRYHHQQEDDCRQLYLSDDARCRRDERQIPDECQRRCS